MRRLILLASVVVTACGGGSQYVQTAPVTQTPFAATLSRAGDEASAGRFATADKALADYAVQHPASSEAVETLYWRAIYQLDPGNTSGSVHDGGVLLDSYIASPSAARRAEATSLRRIASALESAKNAAGAQPAMVVKTEPAVADKAKDEELARLKDELAKANAELERIKRRLAKP